MPSMNFNMQISLIIAALLVVETSAVHFDAQEPVVGASHRKGEGVGENVTTVVSHAGKKMGEGIPENIDAADSRNRRNNRDSGEGGQDFPKPSPQPQPQATVAAPVAPKTMATVLPATVLKTSGNESSNSTSSLGLPVMVGIGVGVVVVIGIAVGVVFFILKKKRGEKDAEGPKKAEKSLQSGGGSAVDAAGLKGKSIGGGGGSQRAA